MHDNSMNLMREFVKEYVDPEDRVLEIGSLNINGTYRDLFPTQLYTGIDFEAGPDVDLVITSSMGYPANEWHKAGIQEAFPIIISGQALEHDKFFWRTLDKIRAYTINAGHVCLIVPRFISEHRHPIDCYRFLSNAMQAWGEYMNMKVLRAETVENDTIGIFKNVPFEEK